MDGILSATRNEHARTRTKTLKMEGFVLPNDATGNRQFQPFRADQPTSMISIDTELRAGKPYCCCSVCYGLMRSMPKPPRVIEHSSMGRFGCGIIGLSRGVNSVHLMIPYFDIVSTTLGDILRRIRFQHALIQYELPISSILPVMNGDGYMLLCFIYENPSSSTSKGVRLGHMR